LREPHTRHHQQKFTPYGSHLQAYADDTVVIHARSLSSFFTQAAIRPTRRAAIRPVPSLTHPFAIVTNPARDILRTLPPQTMQFPGSQMQVMQITLPCFSSHPAAVESYISSQGLCDCTSLPMFHSTLRSARSCAFGLFMTWTLLYHSVCGSTQSPVRAVVEHTPASSFAFHLGCVFQVDMVLEGTVEIPITAQVAH